MNIFTSILMKIRQVINRMLPYRSIEQAEHIESPLSPEMTSALDTWYSLYRNQAPWLDDSVKSLNLPAFISSEIARQIVLEMQWNITGREADGSVQTADGQDIMNPRAAYLKAEFEKLVRVLRQKLEQGCAAGGMIIKPFPGQNDGHVYFDWTMDWAIYPLAFDNDGNLSDVIIPDTFQDGKYTYTRLERHTMTADGVRITQRAFRSAQRDSIGSEVPLSSVERWALVEPEALIKDSGGPLFGWFKVATANNIDVDTPLGASVFAKAVNVIKEADLQYSRLLWEFEGSELAIDVDPTALRPKKNGNGTWELPKLKDRLFRAVDVSTGDNADLYKVFSPQIRDESLLNGLNQLLIRIEDLTGLSRGTISDANVEARTATEMRIIKQRSYATIADNQAALEACLRDVVRVMDKYATLYHLAPEGEYDVSFEWDDSILTDMAQQTQERLMLLNAGIMSKAEFREWYFGETQAQAAAAINALQQEQMNGLNDLLPALDEGVPQP